MKTAIAILTLFCLLIGYRVVELEGQVKQLQTNTAIAVLSAEAANNKIGAIAPYFVRDKEAFARAWIDTLNMPLAVFPEDVIVPIKRSLAEKRSSSHSNLRRAPSIERLV